MRVGLCVRLSLANRNASLAGQASGSRRSRDRRLSPWFARTDAGITPPPGVYFQDDTYFYSGKIGGGTTLPTGGLLVANVSATTWINLPTTLWVTPLKVFGGDLAFSLTTPFGEPRVNANLLVNSTCRTACSAPQVISR